MFDSMIISKISRAIRILAKLISIAPQSYNHKTYGILGTRFCSLVLSLVLPSILIYYIRLGHRWHLTLD